MINCNLEHFDSSYNQCPTCKAGIREMKRGDKHSNGHWNEYIRYECGCRVHYSPNYYKILVENPCRFSPKEIEKQASITLFYTKVWEAAKDTPCLDKKFKERIIEEIKETHSVFRSRLFGGL